MNTIGKDTLRKISGANHRSKILSWLKQLGIPYLLDAHGWPVVAESALTSKLGAPIKDEPRINFA